MIIEILAVSFLISLLAIALGLMGFGIAELFGAYTLGKMYDTLGKYGAQLAIAGALGFACSVIALLIILIVSIVMSIV